MAEAFTIATGGRRKIKSSFFGTSLDIMYDGMSGDNSFSIELLLSKSYHGNGLNLFYPKNSTYIRLDKQKYYVLNVTPENITLQLSET